jgi:MYXO-CTERM domain-containing protein
MKQEPVHGHGLEVRGKVPTMLRTLVSFFILATATLFVLPAQAAGKITISQTEVNEVSGAWRVRMTIELPKAPSMPHIPMKFVFTPTAVFERSLVDGKTEPVSSTTSLSGQTPNIESLDVDFADASGKVFNRTRFDFGVTRTRGFLAGVYKVQVRTSDGVDIGGATTITLKGDNDVVDRRSISFNAKDPKIKKVDNGLDAGAPTKSSNDDVASANNGGDVVASGTAAPFVPQDAYNRTPEEDLKARPKGCGCDVPSAQPWSASAALVLAGLGALMLRRRRTA